MIDQKLYDKNYYLKSRGFQRSQWRRFILKKAIEKYKHDKVLDVGCGIGAFVTGLRKSGIEAYGIDAAEVLERLWNKDYLFLADASDIPFADNTFDIS